LINDLDITTYLNRLATDSVYLCLPVCECLLAAVPDSVQRDASYITSVDLKQELTTELHHMVLEKYSLQR